MSRKQTTNAPSPSRRDLLRGAVASALGLIAVPGLSAPASAAPRDVTFGISTDIHKDVMPDADVRLAAFVQAMTEREVGFIIDLGDFCWPKPANRGFITLFDEFAGPKYHALGNHDIDGGYSWDQTLEYYGMENPHYSFDFGGYHFVVLDGNNKPLDHKSGYPAYVGPEQLEWLEDDLSRTEAPTFVFSHQPVSDTGGHVTNDADVRRVLENAKNAAGQPKVMACFAGHRHVDQHVAINGIQYLDINSMSYYWVGGNHKRTRYPEWIEKVYPYVNHTVPYTDPLYAVVTLSADGRLTLDGRDTAFIPPTPEELGLPAPDAGGATPIISPRKLELRYPG
ncbi:MAG: alkaline phosphatase [bacterium]|nr:alkaline phosphatase [bacterium]